MLFVDAALAAHLSVKSPARLSGRQDAWTPLASFFTHTIKG